MSTSDAAASRRQEHADAPLDSAGARGPLTARVIVTVCALVTMVGAYVADFNATHLFNPRWPPHARFHNAQTMLMATALGACAVLYAWRRDAKGTHLRTATLLAALYWFTNLGSIAFPGTAWADPEFAATGRILGVPTAAAIGVVQLMLLGVALVVSHRRHSGA